MWGLAGCHAVLGVDPEPSASPCGDYGDPVPLIFEPTLLGVTDFSASPDGARGFAHAEHDGRTGLTPITFDGQAWIHDHRYDGNLAQLQTEQFVEWGHITAKGQLIAAQRSQVTGYYTPYEYEFRLDTGIWVLANNQPVSFATGESTFAGGDLAVPTGAGATLDLVPIIHVRDDLSTSVAIAMRQPLDNFAEAVSGGELTTAAINTVHRVTGAALAATPSRVLVLVYAATPVGATTGSDLYVSEMQQGRFPVGEPLTSLNTEAEEVEPWISEDCRTLHFRRGDTVFATVAQ